MDSSEAYKWLQVISRLEIELLYWVSTIFLPDFFYFIARYPVSVLVPGGIPNYTTRFPGIVVVVIVVVWVVVVVVQEIITVIIVIFTVFVFAFIVTERFSRTTTHGIDDVSIVLPCCIHSWTLPESMDDVYTLVSPADIRRARDHARENIETLIDKLMDQMDKLLSSATPQNALLLNCCRVLTRIMPYIFESPECAAWEDKFFWAPRFVEKKAAPSDHDTNDHGIETPVDQKSQYDTLPPRGQVLITLTMKALFLAGFTLPSTLTTADNKVNFVIWETGVGSSTPIGSSRENDANRCEVLKLLTVLLSKSMYTTPSQLILKEDRYVHYMVSKMERKIVLAFLCSMLNTACKYNPLSWSYNMFSDPREQLVAFCLRALLVIVDYKSPINATAISSSLENLQLEPDDDVTNEEQRVESVSENAFRYYLSKLHRAQDFQFLIDGVYKILSNPMQTLNNYIPGSSKRLRYHIEMMMLLWKLLELNGRFRNYLMETERALDLTVVLLYHANENKLDPSQVGLVRMCTFILQTLSSDRTFSVKLNKTFEGHASLPMNSKIPNFQGSYADYFILTIFSLIASSKGSLSTLYSALIKIITNISPYLKNLSAMTSNKLLVLFSSISAPGFLLADESNHHLIKYLLEALNNIIQFQFSNNPQMMYFILRSHQKFEKLSEFTLDNAVLEIEKSRQSKLAAKSDDNTENSNNDQRETNSLLSEKAKGKLPEGASLSRVSSSSSIQSQRQEPVRQSSVSSIHSLGNLLPGAKNGFIPTENWVHKWHSKLPLDTTMTLIHELLPKIESEHLSSAEDIIHYISQQPQLTLPSHHAIVIRKFQWGDALVIWFKSMLWGQAYVASLSNYGPWNNTNIKLFHIKQQQQQQPEETASSPRPSIASRTQSFSSTTA
ncbi:hypothetical protein K501DRAFT_337444 [Backusella circina FSU 941]|nr:hypothetical protein K501DRAFT_337444 [Backusella circina FSU 941]